MSILIVIVVFGIAIFIHELGHFLAMRLFGVEVTEFTIGFGPTLWQRQLKCGTHFRLKPIFFGGYAKPVPGAVEATRWYQQIVIYAAGMLMNVLAASVAISISFVSQDFDQGLKICVLTALDAFRQTFVIWLTYPYLVFQALHHNAAGVAASARGPVGIVQMMAPAFRHSVRAALEQFATLNVLLAGFNLIPLPALDGGRIVLVPFRKLLGQKAHDYLIVVTFLLLLLLMVLITYKDIARLFGH